ncbi:MAG: hypothetical protein RL641_484 [Candidatus Parcubacteria bacterium]|jgi:transcription termination factor NusB
MKENAIVASTVVSEYDLQKQHLEAFLDYLTDQSKKNKQALDGAAQKYAEYIGESVEEKKKASDTLVGKMLKDRDIPTWKMIQKECEIQRCPDLKARLLVLAQSRGIGQSIWVIK